MLTRREKYLKEKEKINKLKEENYEEYELLIKEKKAKRHEKYVANKKKYFKIKNVNYY